MAVFSVTLFWLPIALSAVLETQIPGQKPVLPSITATGGALTHTASIVRRAEDSIVAGFFTSAFGTLPTTYETVHGLLTRQQGKAQRHTL